MVIRANALAVIAKAPLAGQVKSRLTPVFSAEEAAQFSRSLLLDQLNHLQALDSADLYLAFAPENARLLMEQIAPARCHLFPQQGDDLGARMAAVFERLFQLGHKNIALIGGDLPPVPFSFFGEAYAFLEGSDNRVVLGPSRDGGYYFVGANYRIAEIFQGMTWSHSEVLAQTLERLAARKMAYHLLPSWFDIDAPGDLSYLKAVADSDLEKAMPNALALLRRLEKRA
jgi:rSAM/selenodomain-associated transferase 1